MRMRTGRVICAVVPALLLAAVATDPTAAQEGWDERITILVPNLAPGDGLRDRFGNRVASELRSLIDGLHTHQTVSDRALRSALRQYGLSHRDLYDCAMARQFAVQQEWGLVLCGGYDDAGGGRVHVTASFVGARTGEAFDVEPFTLGERDHRQAAQRILQTFDRWQTQLRHTFFCSQYLEREHWEQAETNCEQALAINPASQSARYLLAHVLWQTGRDDDALRSLDQVLEADPTHADALKMAGIVATRLGDRELALSYLDRYMALKPGDVGVRLSIATDIANAGDPEAALRFAQQGMEIEPENLDLITYIGHYAINAALQAESAAADSAHVMDLYRTAAGSYDEILDAFGDATDARVLERLLLARVKLGQLDQAVALGRRATDIAPDNAAIWEVYSRALENTGRVPEALAAIRRAEELGRIGPGMTQRTALLHLRGGNITAAIATLRTAVDRGVMETHDAWRVMFGHAYNDRFRGGHHSDAYQVLDQAAPLAVGEGDRMARNFWMGYCLFEQALRAHEPQTAESARRARPLFERALELFEASRGYEQIEPSAPVARLIENARRFIEIQDALIRRGR